MSSKSILSLLLLFFSALFYSQNVNIPDQAFKNFLINITPNTYQARDLIGNYTKVDSNNDGEIQFSEAENISYISPSTNQDIKDLTGIEHFVNLTEIGLSWMYNLEKLFLTGNTKLQKLYCNYSTKLAEIDITSCVNLESIELNFTQISSIDFTKNKKLKKLSISGVFTELDFSENNLLQELHLTSPNLVSLNLANCINLKKIGFTSTQLSNYNFASASNLEEISLTGIPNLESIDISTNNKLKYLGLNTIPELEDISFPQNSNALNTISIFSCKINNIDYSKILSLENLGLYDLSFSSIDLTKNLNLKSLSITENDQLTTIDVSKNINLNLLNVVGLPNLTSVLVKNGKQQNFGEGFMECPKLVNVCCDESEKTFFENIKILNIVTDCELLESKESNINNGLIAYPNPVKSTIHFSKKINKIQIYTLDGKLIKEKNTNGTFENLEFLQKGVYILKLKTDKDTITQKIIKN